MICVEMGSGLRPSFFATYSSTRGSILAKVPTAPEIWHVAISSRAATRRSRLRANLDSLGGLVDSQRFLLALTQAGMSREDAYRLVQKHAMAAWNGSGRFADLLKTDPEIGRYLTAEAIDASFDTAYHLKHVDTIFRRVFGE